VTVALRALVACSLALTTAGIAFPASAVVAADEACAPGTYDYSTEQPPALDLLQADIAWERATGAGVLVAVVDSGVDAANAHLSGAVVGGIDLVGDGTNPDGTSDVNGHGTAIAGQIAARSIPESGVVGLAPDANLLSVRVYRSDDDQSVKAGFGPSPDRLAAGIRYAADSGAQIINVSMSDDAGSPALAEAVAYATQAGSLVVASAGNAATTDNLTPAPRYPAAYPGALAVTATNESAGATDDSIHGPHVEIAAPGMTILTSATGAGDCIYAAEAPSSSFATAYVSAAAALVAQAHPEETPEQWAYRLMASASRADPDRRDDLLGWGVAQPFEAITLLPDASTRGPESPFVENASSAVRPDAVTVEPHTSPSAMLATQQLLIVVATVGLAVLGTLALMISLRARRRERAMLVAASDGASPTPPPSSAP